jgi:hypothetical protein
MTSLCRLSEQKPRIGSPGSGPGQAWQALAGRGICPGISGWTLDQVQYKPFPDENKPDLRFYIKARTIIWTGLGAYDMDE